MGKSAEQLERSRKRGGHAASSHQGKKHDVYIRKRDIRAEVAREDEERRRRR